MQLPFKRYSKFYYLRTSLAVAYDTYAREQLKLGFKVLSWTRAQFTGQLKANFKQEKGFLLKILSVQTVLTTVCL